MALCARLDGCPNRRKRNEHAGIHVDATVHILFGGGPVNYSMKIVARDMQEAKVEAIATVKLLVPTAVAVWINAITATSTIVE